LGYLDAKGFPVRISDKPDTPQIALARGIADLLGTKLVVVDYVYLDHDQTYTLSAGASYSFGASKLGGDLIFGSGVRRTPDGGPPNGAALPHYTVVNLSLTHTWKQSSTS
jgi:hypothetical protein